MDDALLAFAATSGMGQTNEEFGSLRYTCFLDVRRAFPTMDRRAMLVRLYKEGKVTGRVWRILANMYQSVHSQIWVGEAKGQQYEVGTGAREGSVLSPICYSAFIDGMINAVEAAKGEDGEAAGAVVRGRDDLYFATSAYCDDFAMTSDTPAGLQAMMDAAGKYAEEHLFEFGREKTNVVIFGSDGTAPRWRDQSGRLVRGWNMTALHKEDSEEDDSVEIKDQYTYLGAVVHRDRSWRHHHEAVAKKHGRLKAQAVRDRATGAAGCGGPVAAMIWNGVVPGSLDKAAWATAASDSTGARREEYHGITKLTKTAAYNEIGGRHNGPLEAVMAETGIRPTRDRRESAIVKAHHRVMRMEAERPVRVLVEAAAADGKILGKGWNRAVRKACEAAGAKIGQATGRERWADNEAVNTAMGAVHRGRANKEMRKKAQCKFPGKVHAARMEKHGHTYPAVTSRSGLVLGYSMQRQLCSSTHFLNGCTHLGGDGNKYACVHCGAAREDEAHALLRCPKYSAARQQMLGTIGWPRNEADLVDQDAVRWMVPDASLARCSDLEFFEAVQKFCQEIAGTRNCRK
jgi:hypothetical protein